MMHTNTRDMIASTAIKIMYMIAPSLIAVYDADTYLFPKLHGENTHQATQRTGKTTTPTPNTTQRTMLSYRAGFSSRRGQWSNWTNTLLRWNSFFFFCFSYSS